MNVSKFNVHGEEITVEDTESRQMIGNLADLETTNKTSVVNALNEIKNTKNYGDSLISYDASSNTLTIS